MTENHTGVLTPVSSGFNFLKPIESSLEIINQMIDAQIHFLEWIILKLQKLRTPHTHRITWTDVTHALVENVKQAFRDILAFPTAIINFQLTALRSVEKLLFSTFDWSLFFVNSFTEKMHIHIPPAVLTRMKHRAEWILRKPSDLANSVKEKVLYTVDYSKHHMPRCFTSCLKYSVNEAHYISRLPYLMMVRSYETLTYMLPGHRKKGKGITQLEKYNQELIDLIQRERQQHYEDSSKLNSLEKEGATANEILDKTKSEFDAEKQQLLLKIAKEIEQHKQDLEELTIAAKKDKVSSDEKLTQAANNFDKQRQELLKKIDDITLASQQEKADAEDRIQKMTSDCKRHNQELLDKLETEHDMNLQLEKLKLENEQQKEAFFPKVSKEREEHQKELDDLIALRRDERTKTDEKLAQLNKDFAAQKQTLLIQIDSERNDCTKRIEQVKATGLSEKTTSEEKLIKANQSLEAQKQDLSDQITKEREEFKQQIDQLSAQRRDDNSSSNARIEQLTADFEKQKQILSSDLKKERDSSQQKIKQATDAQSTLFDAERQNLNMQIKTLQGSVDDLLKKTGKSVVNEISNKVNTPLQEVGFGKMYK